MSLHDTVISALTFKFTFSGWYPSRDCYYKEQQHAPYDLGKGDYKLYFITHDTKIVRSPRSTGSSELLSP